MKSHLFTSKKLSHLTLIVIFLFTFSKQSFAQTKSFFEGPYVGGAIGYTTYKTRFNDPVNEPDNGNNWYLVFDGGVFKKTDNLDGKNINGTISTGYNWIFDKNYILGLEAEASSGKKIVHSSTTQNSEWSADINYIANLRLKAGTIHEDKNLFYVTVGPAMAKARYSARYFDAGVKMLFSGDGEFPISINKTVYGLSYGVGVERQIDDKTSMKLEYMLTDLDSKSKPYPESGDGTGCSYPRDGVTENCIGPSWKTKISSIRIGYNYHF
jgi:opacity protein-like surface antigen